MVDGESKDEASSGLLGGAEEAEGALTMVAAVRELVETLEIIIALRVIEEGME